MRRPPEPPVRGPCRARLRSGVGVGEDLGEVDRPAFVDRAVRGDAHRDREQALLRADVGSTPVADRGEHVEVLEVRGSVVEPLVLDAIVVHDFGDPVGPAIVLLSGLGGTPLIEQYLLYGEIAMDPLAALETTLSEVYGKFTAERTEWGKAGAEVREALSFLDIGKPEKLLRDLRALGAAREQAGVRAALQQVGARSPGLGYAIDRALGR